MKLLRRRTGPEEEEEADALAMVIIWLLSWLRSSGVWFGLRRTTYALGWVMVMVHVSR
jgi:hypothetical protein